MTIWEFRQWIESRVPLWVPVAIAIVAITCFGFFGLMRGAEFLEGDHD